MAVLESHILLNVVMIVSTIMRTWEDFVEIKDGCIGQIFLRGLTIRRAWVWSVFG
jgi:hypothetical protein